MNRNERRRQDRFNKRTTVPRNTIIIDSSNIEHFMIANMACEYASMHHEDFFKEFEKWLIKHERQLKPEVNSPDFFYDQLIRGMKFYDNILQRWLETQQQQRRDRDR